MDKNYVIVAIERQSRSCVVRVFGPYAEQECAVAEAELRAKFQDDWMFQRRWIWAHEDAPLELAAAASSYVKLAPSFDAPRRPRALADPAANYHTPDL